MLSCIWNLRLFLDDATGMSVPLHVMTSSSGLHLKRCPGIGTFLEWTRKSVSLGMRHDTRGFLSNFSVRPASSCGGTCRSGSPSRQSRGIDPHVQIRRGEWLRLSGAGKISVPLERDQYVGELFELHQRCQIPFGLSRGNVGFLLRRGSGKGLHLAMTGEHSGFREFRRDSRVMTGNSGSLLCCPRDVQSPFGCEGELEIALVSQQGQ